jgi:hypothetical protein
MNLEEFILCNDVISQLAEDGHDELAEKFMKEVVAPIVVRERRSIDEQLEAIGQIAIIWSVEDVQQERPDLSDEQAMQVLKVVKEEHDANMSVGWQTIDLFASDLFPQSHDKEGGHDDAA